MKRRIGTVFALLLTVAVFGGGACSTPGARGDSESHFLHECVETCASGLECLCGICTRTCTESAQCSSLAAKAECATPLESACAAHGKQCDVACLTDGACRGLGSGYSCVGGRCRDTGGKDAGGAVAPQEGGAGSPDTGGANGGCNNNGTCDTPETATSCPNDCACNHDGVCNGYENTASCPADCGSVLGCTPVRWPDPPASPEGGSPEIDGGTHEFVTAVKTVRFGDAPSNAPNPPTDYLKSGFDLDGRCTEGSGAALKTNQECAIPSDSPGVEDGSGGIDNAFGKLMQSLRDVLQNWSSPTISVQIAEGAPTAMLRVQHYNGLSNDDGVTVTFLSTANFDSPPRTKGSRPAWDGTDAWPIDTRSLVNDDPAQGRYVDTEAYVSDGTLVARFNQLTYRVVVGLNPTTTVDLTLRFTDAHLSCAFQAGFIAPVCTLAGRLLADDLVHQLSQFPDPANLDPLCTDSNLFPTFASTVCNLVDVPQFPGATADTCTGLSFGMTFIGAPALVGSVFQVRSPSEPCPAGARPSEVSCACVSTGCRSVDAGGGAP